MPVSSSNRTVAGADSPGFPAVQLGRAGDKLGKAINKGGRKLGRAMAKSSVKRKTGKAASFKRKIK